MALCSQAVEPRAAGYSLSLTFDETTAVCEASCRGDKSTDYPFYRILFQHEDYHRTEVVVNGSFLLIGSTTGPGLTVYQASDDSLLGGLNALF